MKVLRRRGVAVAALSAVAVGLTAPYGGWAVAVSPTTSRGTDPGGPDAREIRSIFTSEFGVSRPTGVSWDADREALVVTGDRKLGGSKLVRVTPGEERLGKSHRAGLDDGSLAAFDPRSHSMENLEDDPAVDAQVVDPAGTAYSSDGTRHVLDAATNSIVSIAPSGETSRLALEGMEDANLRGLAVRPRGQRLYVADVDAEKLYGVNDDGAVVASHDLSGANIGDLQAMTFAPSADTTDPASDQSLYIADAGTKDELGRVAEVGLAAAVAAEPTATGNLVVSRPTSSWSPASPDPSGVTYVPGSNRLLVSDGEVDEIAALYQNVNLYASSLAGVKVAGGGKTPPWSNEPTGIGYNVKNGNVYISDDDKKSIFVLPGLGADGIPGSADDGTTAPPSFKTSTYGNTDPEDVAFDSKTGELLLVDGVGMEVFRLKPGPNGTFNGVAPGGDDTATQFDIEILGAQDPEGIAYDEVRDTMVVVDGSADLIFELDANGSLLNAIDISGIDAQKAAGITIAPASDGSGKRHYYIADRGLDNNSHPGENDGMIHEVSANLPAITNRPPAASAGIDQLIDLPETAQLVGTATDDGKPAPVTYRWSVLNSPVGGQVTFGTPNAKDTTAKFSAVGAYTLRLTVSDSQLTDFDDVVVQVHQPGSARTVAVPIVSGADDAQQGGGSTGDFVDLSSADNELGNDGKNQLVTGLRFADLPVPNKGEIVSAKIQFRVDEVSTSTANFTVVGEAADNPPTYVHGGGGDIGKRIKTTSTVNWRPPAWNLVGETAAAQQTPELKTILQEIVNRRGWAQGNAAAFMVSGTGRRTAEAKDGLSAPVLMLTFKMQPANTAPVVTATAPASVELPTKANLDGTVTDDGQPLPAALTRAWTKVSGPGTVAFGNPAAEDTTAEFSEPGTYVLRLTANDGALSHHADVTVVAEPGVRTMDLRASTTGTTVGRTVTLTGKLLRTADSAPMVNQKVELMVSRAGQPLESLGTVTTGADGAFSMTDTPPVNTSYTARDGLMNTAAVDVSVRPRLTTGVAPGYALVRSSVTVRGTVGPTASRQPVVLQRWSSGNWRTAQRKYLAAGSSRGYAFGVRHDASGTFRYRVVTPAFAGRASTTSRTLTVRFGRVDIDKVRARGDEFVRVKNTGSVSVSMRFWKLRNTRNGRVVRIPSFTLKPGRVVRIHTGRGRSDGNDLYLGKRAMWGSHGKAVLRDTRGALADRYRY